MNEPQYGRILDILSEPGGVTVLEMMERLGIADIRKRVSELRAAGFDIRDRWEKNSNGGKHKRYWLEDRDAGHRFRAELGPGIPSLMAASHAAKNEYVNDADERDEIYREG